MTINEKNLLQWLQATGNQKPDNAALQMARSLACEPEFLGLNLWQTPSTNNAGVVHRQQIYFAGFDNAYSHGMKLNVECSCPSRVTCKHALKLQRVYCANWSYLYILFGMEESKRFGELWTRAVAIYELMERNARQLAA